MLICLSAYSFKKVEPDSDPLEFVLDLDTLTSIKDRIAPFEAKSYKEYCICLAFSHGLFTLGEAGCYVMRTLGRSYGEELRSPASRQYVFQSCE